MSNLLEISFPDDFNEKYQEYRQILLDVLSGKELQTPKLETQENTTIEITKKVEPQEENLLFPIPKNAHWEDITIKFKNDFDVDVIVKGKTYSSDYEKMQFADKRIKKTDEKAKANDGWKFLFLLSTLNGVFPLDKLTGKDKKRTIKQKQSLSKSLVKLFKNIEDNDPFYEFNDIDKNYKIKIKLIPVETFREDFRDKDITDESEYTKL